MIGQSFSVDYVPKLLINRTNWKRQRIFPFSQILVAEQPMKTADADSDNAIWYFIINSKLVGYN